jgi:hypothetical protein
MNLRIRISDGVTPKLQSAMKALNGPGLTALHHAAGVKVQELTRDHIAGLKRNPDSLASRIGAPTSNFYAQAAEKVGGDAALTANAGGATLVISSIGFKRAFQSMTIVPRTAKSLAIPINRISFGHRAAELWDRMHLFIPKGENVIAATIGGVLTPLYVLCKSVTQKQDRSLLPSDAKFLEEAVKGARGYLQMLWLQKN